MAAERIHVVAGIILDGKGNVCLAQRKKHQHQGGLWEFPGGKKEQGESAINALHRELKEELGIRLNQTHASLFQTVQHDYSDKSVLLEFWLVNEFKGSPQGCEGQWVQWVPINHLCQYAFPEANQTIVDLLQAKFA